MTNLSLDFMAGSAFFSACGRYRFSLTRNGLGGTGRMLMILCNPSKAGAEVEDNTSRRCVGFAKREGMGTLVIVNPFAYCATDPADLVRAHREGINIVGVENDRVIHDQASQADMIVMGCGAPSSYGTKAFQGLFKHRVHDVVRRLSGHRLLCLGTTAEGWPRHPRLLRADAALEPWRMPQ